MKLGCYQMTTKINIFEVIRYHLDTIRDYDTHKLGFFDVVIFFVFPVVVALSTLLVCRIDATTIGILITAFSIFTALLLNLLVLIFSITKGQAKKVNGRAALRHKVLKEIFANISFGILSCAFLTALLVVLLFAGISGLVVSIHFAIGECLLDSFDDSKANPRSVEERVPDGWLTCPLNLLV